MALKLSDLADAVAAMSNLGLGSLAVQSAGSVAITSGRADVVPLDGDVRNLVNACEFGEQGCAVRNLDTPHFIVWLAKSRPA